MKHTALEFVKKNKNVILSTVIVNFLGFSLYFISGLIVNHFQLYKTNILIQFDNYIPRINTFVIFYFSWYFFVFIAPIFIGIRDKILFRSFILIKIIELLIFFLVFVIYPTYVAKDVLPNHNIFDVILNFIYSVDIGNAFPSEHCFSSWNIYLLYKNSKNVSLKSKMLVFIISFLICCSTVFTKQHGIIDVFAAILLCEIMWLIIKKMYQTGINKKL